MDFPMVRRTLCDCLIVISRGQFAVVLNASNKTRHKSESLSGLPTLYESGVPLSRQS